jgi:N-carbamoyl-L-amino-acid hydrolase
MSMRCDSGVVAALVLAFVRRLALDMGGSQVATVGALSFVPNLVNVIPKQVTMTVDLRNTSEASLAEAEARTAAFIAECAQAEGVRVRSRSLARFAPVEFDPSLVQAVEQAAGRLGFSSRRLPSGAGHDAQMFAPNCQSAMIFIPSAGGLSHNTEEFSSPAEIEAGARVLLSVVLGLAG